MQQLVKALSVCWIIAKAMTKALFDGHKEMKEIQRKLHNRGAVDSEHHRSGKEG